MNLRQLEIFTAVVETQNFSRAAELLFISQPSVSISITQLEKDLETKLLNRTTKLVTPTEAGNLLYERAKQIIQLCKNTQADVYETANPDDLAKLARKLDIYASSLSAQYILPAKIADFHREYPNVKINVRMIDSLNVIKKVLHQEIDFGIISIDPQNDNLEKIKIYEDKLVLISKEPANYKDLKTVLYNTNFIARKMDSGTRLIYDQHFQKLKINREQLNITTSFNNTTSVINAVASGLGIAIVSELAARCCIQQQLVHVVPNIDLPKRNYYIIKRKGHQLSTAARLFTELLLEPKE